jgi:serine/threonine-protein kinase
MTVGSLYYMSPEQAQGGTIDGRSDIYSLGITMYELLAGRRPFEDDSAYVILHSQLTVVPRPPIEVNPLLSKPMSDLILKALEKDPARRFQNAAAFSDALRQVTGIAASALIENAAVITPPIALRAGNARNVLDAEAARTSRFSTAVPRRLWIATEALAVLVVVVFGVLGLPHLLKTVATAKTISHTSTKLPSFPMAPHDGIAATDTRQSAAITPPDPTGILHKDPALAPAIAPAPPQARAATVSISQHVRPAGARLSRVEYQPASLPNTMTEGEEQAKPSLSASTRVELQDVRNQMAELDARTAAARISVKRLKSEQEAAGASLSQDVAGAYVRMNAYLSAEKADLEDGDVAAARDHLEKTKYEVSSLENLLKK